MLNSYTGMIKEMTLHQNSIQPRQYWLRLVFTIFHFFHQVVALQRPWKMLFISSKKISLLSRNSNFCISVSPLFLPVGHCFRGLLKINLKGAISGLRQFLATKSPLKIMKNAFYFTTKALFVLNIYIEISVLNFRSCRKTAWLER